MEILVAVILAAHLLCVDIASAGPLVCIWLDWRGRRDAAAREAGRWLTKASLAGLVVGGLLGLAAGAIYWTPEYRSILHRLQSKIYWAGWELSFSLVLNVIYAAWLTRTAAPSAAAWSVRSLLALVSASNLLYHFPLLMSVIAKLATQRDFDGPPIDAAAFRGQMVAADILANSCHFWLASLAVTGVAIVWYALRLRHDDVDAARRVAHWGAFIALVPTLLQLPVGIWLLTTQSPAAQQRLLGDVIGVSLLGASVVASLSLMHQLAAIAFGDVERRTWWKAVWLTALVVLLMTAAQRRTHPRGEPPPAKNMYVFQSFDPFVSQGAQR